MFDYKNTLNLPSTKFPMRANLPILELEILNRWYIDNLYKIIRNKKNNKKFFLLHDGPPYANGRIHLGHAVNKILKDIIIKFKGLSGYNAPYIPGWDCHGLPIELQVEQLIKETGNHMNDKNFRELCRQYAMQQIKDQKQDFIRLGVIGDWDHAYLTMNYHTEANIIRSLNTIISNGYIYRGIKPVYWCFQCHSALATLEVEYRHHRSDAVDIGFLIVDKSSINKIFKTNLCIQNIELVIWTTALWTIPANYAVAVHPDYIYQLIEIPNRKFIIIAANLVNHFMQRLKYCVWKVLGESIGNTLEYIKICHPFMSIHVPIILSNHVTLESGTGCVHIAPNHGPDDHILAKKYNIKNIKDFIDDKGFYLSNVPDELKGKHIFKSNHIIIELLHKSNNLLHIDSNYYHSYPYCWRHFTPLIFRTTSQWFFNMNHNDFRNKLLKIIQGVSWLPKKGYSSIKSMIINRPDWCISRQRMWGVPIPILVHKKTGQFHPDIYNLIEKVAKLVEKDGVQAWWKIKIEDLILNKDIMFYEKVYDTLDVWFDSGSTYDSVILKQFGFLNNINGGADLYLEGSDQYRGWFMSSLVISVAIHRLSPYKTVLSHGFTVDSLGNKMSKSLGNTMDPKDIINKFGSDILRLWVASADYSKDLTISNDILQHVTDVYRRIRNTIRFCIANLYDFNSKIDIIQPENMVELDRWAINQACLTQFKIISYYKTYQFHNVVQHIMKFCSVKMSAFYLDVIKDRLYTFKKNSIYRRSCQTALYHIIETIVRWIAPILSFTADEVWRYIPGARSKSVFIEEWYDRLFELDNTQLMNNDDWKLFFQIRNSINKVIEQARVDNLIKGSLEADITLYIDSKLINQLNLFKDELAFGLLISSINILDYYNYNVYNKNNINDDIKLKIILKKSEGIKCLRCWNYSLKMSQNKNYLNICFRCLHNIIGTGEHRKYF